MNKEEELSKQNLENYELYLKRMTESMKYSTKGLIPIFAVGSKSVLDVGCGSGVLLNALLEYDIDHVIGIDINGEAVKKIENLNNDKIEVYKSDIKEFIDKNISVDAVVYSSVLHEVSSYCENENLRYTLKPIEDILKDTYDLLPIGGKIIIRDCIMVDHNDLNKKVRITFKDDSESKWLYRFKEEFIGFKGLDVDMTIEKIDNSYRISYAFLKEFLYTYTWGEGSWNREINERVGIMDSNTWEKMVSDSGFRIDKVLYSKEEYEKYLNPKVDIIWDNNEEFVYPYMNILIVAIKNK